MAGTGSIFLSQGNITAAISGNTLTVSAASGIPLGVGQTIVGVGVAAGTLITALGTGTGGPGTYTIGGAAQTVASEAMFNGGTVATVSPSGQALTVASASMVPASDSPAFPVDTVVKGTATSRSTIIPVGAVSGVVVAGGTGAAVGDVLTLVGGTLTPANAATGTAAGVPTQFNVTTVSSGAVTGLSLKTAGSYTALPSYPAATTSSGAGTGATITPTNASQAITLMPPNSSRRGTRVQPQGSVAYISGLAAATTDQNSLKIPADALDTSDPQFVGTGALSIISSATVPVPVFAREF